MRKKALDVMEECKKLFALNDEGVICYLQEVLAGTPGDAALKSAVISHGASLVPRPERGHVQPRFCPPPTAVDYERFQLSFDEDPQKRLIHADAMLEPKTLVHTELRPEIAEQAIASLGKRVSRTADPKEKRLVKFLTMSAGLLDRVTSGTMDSPETLVERIEEELVWQGRPQRKCVIASELQCLRRARKEHKRYVQNTALYYNSEINGIPDALVVDEDEKVIRCAEFKLVTTKGKKALASARAKGSLQLACYLEMLGLDEGDLFIDIGSEVLHELVNSRYNQTSRNKKAEIFRDFLTHLRETNQLNDLLGISASRPVKRRRSAASEKGRLFFGLMSPGGSLFSS